MIPEPFTTTPGIDALRELNRKLTDLLDDPQPGLPGWRVMLSDTLLEMADYAGYGNTADVMALVRDLVTAHEANNDGEMWYSNAVSPIVEKIAAAIRRGPQ